jgi:hypothetical protein
MKMIGIIVVVAPSRGIGVIQKMFVFFCEILIGGIILSEPEAVVRKELRDEYR